MSSLSGVQALATASDPEWDADGEDNQLACSSVCSRGRPTPTQREHQTKARQSDCTVQEPACGRCGYDGEPRVDDRPLPFCSRAEQDPRGTGECLRRRGSARWIGCGQSSCAVAPPSAAKDYAHTRQLHRRSHPRGLSCERTHARSPEHRQSRHFVVSLLSTASQLACSGAVLNVVRTVGVSSLRARMGERQIGRASCRERVCLYV